MPQSNLAWKIPGWEGGGGWHVAQTTGPCQALSPCHHLCPSTFQVSQALEMSLTQISTSLGL